jgi:hypothetical protein
MANAKPIEVRVGPQTGQLMTGISADNAGVANWTIKRDWRRSIDQEVLAEGCDQFAPNPVNVIQPNVGGQAITLVAWVKRGNGRIAVVVGTKTKLFRYFGVDNGAYFEGVADTAYFDDADQYCDDNPGAWILIGEGFSNQGQRWEAVAINGYLILNNGVDLPVTYRVEDAAVEVIFELREQGIASVGTICAHNSILMCFDIRQLNADKHVEIMSPIASAANALVTGIERAAVLGKVNSGVDGTAGNTLTAAGNVFDISMVGSGIRMANGLARTITAVLSPTQATLDGDADLAEPNQPFYFPGADDNAVTPDMATLFPGRTLAWVGLRLFWASGDFRTIVGIDGAGRFLVDSDAPVPSGAVSVENPAAYAAFTDEANIDQFSWRSIWSMPKLPRRFGAIIPCSIDPTSNTVTLKYPVRSLEAGQSVLILGAGTGGGNLTANIAFAMPKQLLLADLAITDAASQIFDDIAAARAAQEAAQVTLNSTASTLLVAQEALDSANTASDAAKAAAAVDPTDATLTQAATDASAAAADASAKVDAARAANTAAQTALTTATDALTKAEAELQPADSTLQAADAAASITGKFYDLVGDGSGILKALTLKQRVLVYKANSTIFMGSYTGDVNTPFVFDDLETPAGKSLKYRDTLVSVDGDYHIYAGPTGFYRMDLVRRTPMEMKELELCKDVFFNADKSGLSLGPPIPPTAADSVEGTLFIVYLGLEPTKTYQWQGPDGTRQITGQDAFSVEISLTQFPGSLNYSLSEVVSSAGDLVFAVDNPITREIFICFPSSGQDKALRFDYRYGTVSTTSQQITAACGVERPESQVQVGKAEVWFVMGDANGLVLRYGLINAAAQSAGVIKVSKAAGSSVLVATAPFFSTRMIGKSIRTTGNKWFAIIGVTDALHATTLALDNQGALAADTFTIENAIYHRDSQAYYGVLQSGLDAFGSSTINKLINGYILFLASNSPSTELSVVFRGGVNPDGASDILNTTIPNPQSRNLVPVTLEQFFIGDRITASGVNHLAALVARVFPAVSPVGSRSFERRP